MANWGSFFWGPLEEPSVENAVSSDMVWHMDSLKKVVYYIKTCNKTAGLVGVQMKSGAQYSKPLSVTYKKDRILKHGSAVSHMLNG